MWVGVLAVVVVGFVWFASALGAFHRIFQAGGWWWGLRIANGTIAIGTGNRLDAELKAWTDGWLATGTMGIHSRYGVLTLALPFWLLELVLIPWTARAIYRFLKPTEEWDGVKELLPLVDWFLPNENEAKAITGAADVMQAGKILAGYGCGVVIKNGEAGAMAAAAHIHDRSTDEGISGRGTWRTGSFLTSTTRRAWR